MRDEDVTINWEMWYRWKRNAVLIFFDLLLEWTSLCEISCLYLRSKDLVRKNSEFAIMSADSKVNVIAFFPRVTFTLFLAPFALAERVEDKLKNRINTKSLITLLTFPSSKRTLMWSGTSLPLKSAAAWCKFTVKRTFRDKEGWELFFTKYLPNLPPSSLL